MLAPNATPERRQSCRCSQLRNDSEKLAFARSLGHKDTTMADKIYGQALEEKEAMAMVAADALARAGIGG